MDVPLDGSSSASTSDAKPDRSHSAGNLDVIQEKSEDNLLNQDKELTSNWVHQYGSTKIVELQNADPDLSPVIKWLKEGIVPPTYELHLQSPTTKSLWLCRNQLHLKCGVLFH